ncbi:hypothetical protein BJ742DRAFT_787195 [Cladochytrium replicatum]|nr:hypothetical protein BJ742DRAFT_787195 [Cladochytrium replicatum]
MPPKLPVSLSYRHSALVVGVLYLIIVRLLRYRNVNKIRVLADRIRRANAVRGGKPLEHKNGDPLMSPDVEELVRLSAYDFTSLYIISVELALFKTYAIPTISSLLHKTGEFRRNAEKRAEDTALLLGEARENVRDPERANLAIERINEIHARYRIRNEDMLYTLALFILEPKRWIAAYGFRSMEPAEYECNFQYWRNHGIEQGIKDIPETVEEMEKWVEKFEETDLKYAETNRRVAEYTVELLLKPYPSFLHPLFYQIVMAVLEPKMRRAFGYPDPNPIISTLVHGSLSFSGWFTRWFLLPRMMNPRRTSPGKDKNGMYRTLWSPFPSHMYGKGYRIEELGPAPAMKVKPVYGKREE